MLLVPSDYPFAPDARLKHDSCTVAVRSVGFFALPFTLSRLVAAPLDVQPRSQCMWPSGLLLYCDLTPLGGLNRRTESIAYSVLVGNNDSAPLFIVPLAYAPALKVRNSYIPG